MSRSYALGWNACPPRSCRPEPSRPLHCRGLDVRAPHSWLPPPLDRVFKAPPAVSTRVCVPEALLPWSSRCPRQGPRSRRPAMKRPLEGKRPVPVSPCTVTGATSMSGPNMNSSRTSHAGVSLGNSQEQGTHGRHAGGGRRPLVHDVGRNRSRIASCSRIMPYASSPKDQTSLGPPSAPSRPGEPAP